MLLQDMHTDVPSTRTPFIVTPRLRKNRRVENKWGLHYEVSLQYAAFGRQCLPYMPTEPPPSLSEEVLECEPLYVCHQCKDCFRFQSSLEDHSNRRSWIFGVWCQSCFRTVCTHVTEIGSVCTICMLVDHDKRSYLRSRGFGKQHMQKWGAIRVFYNQCQLFEHMKLHNMCSIDVSDVMLMPVPANLNYSDWTPEVELACEALMEHTFLLHVHIMDWLRLNGMENNWWKLINNSNENDDNKLIKIVRGYKGHQLFKTFGNSEKDQDLKPDISNASQHSLAMEFSDSCYKEKDKNNHFTDTTVLDKNVSESEDNPCMSTDITFIDCGPVLTCLEPEPTASYASKNQKSVLKNSRQSVPKLHSTYKIAKTNCKRRKIMLSDMNLIEMDMVHENISTVSVEKDLSKNTVSKRFKGFSQQYKTEKIIVKKTVGNSISKPIIEADVAKILDNPIKINIPLSAKNIKLRKVTDHFAERSLQKSTKTATSKMPPVQSSRKTNATSVINDLPSQLISNNRNVVSEENPQEFISIPDKNIIVVEKKPEKKMSAHNCTDIGTLLQNTQVTGKVLIKNGKKYLIKHSESIRNTSGNSTNLSAKTNVSKGTKQLISKQNSSTSMPINSGEVENISVEPATSPHNDISFLTPSPSPSELSSSSSCESHAKQGLKANFRKVPPPLISLDEKNSHEVITLTKEENDENLYMNIKIMDHNPKHLSLDINEEISQHKEQMIQEFYKLNKFELMERVNHLQHISEEVKKVLSFLSSNSLKDKQKSINTFQLILEDCLRIRKSDQNVQEKRNNNAILSKWESEKTSPQEMCPACRKPMKPKSYIAGFSKLSKNDDNYCFCYKFVCHQCSAYLGNSSRFDAHKNLHLNREPFACPDCSCNFPDATLLEIHMWTTCFHTLKRRVLFCKLCDIDGFRDMEAIVSHFIIMHSALKVVCDVCHIVLSSHEDYMKHYATLHASMPTSQPIWLVVCKFNNEVVRYEKFMSYLSSCPAIQEFIWYKCPFCTLATIENVNITVVLSSHIRDMHLKRLANVISKEAFLDVVTKIKLKQFPIVFEDINYAPYGDGTVIPKIVNPRSISSETFEHGFHNPTTNTWPTNLVEAVLAADENSQVTQKEDSSPTILNVTSTAAPDDVATKPAILTDATTELDSPTFSAEARSERGTNDVCANSYIESTEDINSKFASNISGRIKVVDIRKICKPNVKPFIDVESRPTQPENEKAVHVPSIPKPPPLARIPQYILDYREAQRMHQRKIDKLKKVDKRPYKKKTRLAIVGPADVLEDSIEFLCHICNDRIDTSWDVVRTHFAKKHSREYLLSKLSLSLKKVPSNYKKHCKQLIRFTKTLDKKREAKAGLPLTKRKRRWTPKKHTETNASELGFCVSEETAEDGEGNFKCKRCGQRCTDMSDLREHIAANHRLKGRYLICLECGENFVVAPSLQMHLKAFHGIEDPISYMSRNPSYASDASGDWDAEGRTTVANQCYVCMAVFEDKAAVDKHLRVHGMAFLNRKRIEARNALKSPEKKPEENKQSPVTERPKDAVRRDKPVETILEKLNAAM